MNTKIDNQESQGVVQPKRPQEPQRPYPYYEEEVTFENKESNITLAGTFTTPRSNAPFPAVVLIAGSGPHARDAEKAGHKTMLVLADHLTRKGIAVLRFDKRGCGASTGNFETATTQDFAHDAQAGIKYLKSRNEINPKQIGLVGHSEGCMIAATVAAESKDIAFVVMMGAPAVIGEEILYEQCALLARASGETEEAIMKGQELIEQMCCVLKNEADDERAKQKICNIYAHYAQTLSESQKVVAQKAILQEAFELMRDLPGWTRSLITFDPTPLLQKITVPLLALFGERDLLVPPKQNLEPFRKALMAASNNDVTILNMPELNHRFQHCKIGTEHEYAEIEETMSPEVLSILSDWILARTNKNEDVMDKALTSKSQINNVFLNHLYAVIDKKTYEAIQKSDFLKNEFCHCQEKSHSSENMSWTGIYLIGESTYFELFNKEDKGMLEAVKPGDIGIALSVDTAEEIDKIAELIKQKCPKNINYGLFEKKIDNRLVPWFNYIESKNDFSMMPALDTWIMAYHKDYVANKIEGSSDDGITRKEYNKICNAVPYDDKKLFKNIEEVTLWLSDDNKRKFVYRQQLLGYDCEDTEDSTICRGPGVIFRLKSSIEQPDGFLKLRMSLNRNTHTQQIYTLGNSTFELNNDTATWTFKRSEKK